MNTAKKQPGKYAAINGLQMYYAGKPLVLIMVPPTLPCYLGCAE